MVAWKIVFLQSLSFLQVIGENNVSGSQVYPLLEILSRLEAVQARAKKNRSLKFVFLQNPIDHKGSLHKRNEPQRGIANLTSKQQLKNLAILFQGPSNS